MKKTNRPFADIVRKLCDEDPLLEQELRKYGERDAVGVRSLWIGVGIVVGSAACLASIVWNVL